MKSRCSRCMEGGGAGSVQMERGGIKVGVKMNGEGNLPSHSQMRISSHKFSACS